MRISALDLFIPAGEAREHARKILAKISALQDASAEPADNGVITRGRVNLGISVPFEALWQCHLAANEDVRPPKEGMEGERPRSPQEVIVTLERLKASVFGMGGDAMADGLMKLLAKKLEGFDGVRVEGRAIRADAGVVLKQQANIELCGVLREVAVTREGVLIRIEKGEAP